jgi:DNA-binding response OmpR family regulator
VDLRRREYALLLYLAREPARVIAKAELLRHVWGYPADDATRTVDSHASRLRRKLAEAGAAGWVSSTWGVGYCLAPRAQLPTGGRHGKPNRADPARRTAQMGARAEAAYRR